MGTSEGRIKPRTELRIVPVKGSKGWLRWQLWKMAIGKHRAQEPFSSENCRETGTLLATSTERYRTSAENDRAMRRLQNLLVGLRPASRLHTDRCDGTVLIMTKSQPCVTIFEDSSHTRVFVGENKAKRIREILAE